MPNLKQQAKNAFIWDFAGKLAMQGSGFIVTIFLARLLEPSDFGLIAMIMVIIGITHVFTDIGLGGALIQRKRVLPIHYSSVFFFNLFTALVLSLIVFLSAPWIGDFYNHQEITPLAQVLSLSFIIGALSSVQSTKLRKELEYPLLTKISLVSSLLSGTIGISLAFNGAGVWSLVAQSLSQGIFYTLFIWNAARWKPTMEFSSKALFQLWGFGFRMFLSGLLDAIFTRIDAMIIGKLFSPATLGFFQQAKSLNQLVVRYSSESLMSILFPVLSKIQNDLARFQQVIIKSMGVISFVVFLLLGGLYITSDELVVLVFGEKWVGSVYFFKILALSGFVYPISALLVNVLSSRGNSRTFLRLEIYKKLLVSLNFGVLYIYGIEFFLYGMIVTGIINVSWNIRFVSKEIDLSFRELATPVIVQASIATVSVWITMYPTELLDVPRFVMFILQGLIFAAIYLLLSWGLKTAPYMHTYTQIQPYLTKQRNPQ